MAFQRNYIQARNLRQEAAEKINNYDAILGRVKKDYDELREKGIECRAFSENSDNSDLIHVTKACWNHVFKHNIKRKAKIEKLERALSFPMAIKLLKKTTTYQEVSKERDKGGNHYLSFGIIGYIRGNRIKVIIRKQEKNTNAKLVLFSFYQMSHAPLKKVQ